MRPIASDTHPQRSRRAALSLRLPHRMQDALAYALQIAAGRAQMLQFTRQRILDVLVLAASALQDQLDLDVVALPLLEMDDRRLLAQVVAGVLSRQRVD